MRVLGRYSATALLFKYPQNLSVQQKTSVSSFSPSYQCLSQSIHNVTFSLFQHLPHGRNRSSFLKTDGYNKVLIGNNCSRIQNIRWAKDPNATVGIRCSHIRRKRRGPKRGPEQNLFICQKPQAEMGRWQMPSTSYWQEQRTRQTKLDSSFFFNFPFQSQVVTLHHLQASKF